MALVVTGNFMKNSQRYFEYRCDVCGNEDYLREDHYKNGIGCNVCSNKKVVKGINDVATTNPELIPYFKNKEDIYLYCAGSGRSVDVSCPICGFEKKCRVVDVKEFSCPRCSDGISFPNRYVCNVLSAANIEFETEKKFSWSNNRRYDFYVPASSMIIEVHGGQHYTNIFEKHNRIFARNPEIDSEKKKFALENGIENYVEIDARKSEPEYIKEGIYASKILPEEELNTLDWNVILEKSLKNIAQQCLDEWEKTHDLKIISEALHICTSTVRKYLILLSEAGKCDYDPRIAVHKCQEFAKEARKRKIICLTTGEVFGSIKDAADTYGIKHSTLYECLARKRRGNSTRAITGKNANGVKLEWMILEEYKDGLCKIEMG